MPVYNSGNFLSTAVNSILSHPSKDIELILVDDGSTDGSSERCDEYAEKDSRVTVIHQKNSGICNARNAAIKIAKGEYIGFCDHDDEFASETWVKCIDAIEKYHHPDIVKFGKDYVFVNAKGETFRTIHMTTNDSFYEKEYIIEHYLELRQQNLFRFVWDGIYKKEIIINNQVFFDPYFTHGGEDHDFCNELSKYVETVVTFSGIYYYHYLRDNFSTSSKRIANAGLLHYKVEGERLYETLKTIGYDFNKHRAIYLNQIFESSVLTIIRYHLKARSSDKYIINLLNEIADSFYIKKEKDPHNIYSLLKQSKKVGLFSYLFFSKKYYFLLFIIKLRYKFLK